MTLDKENELDINNKVHDKERLKEMANQYKQLLKL